MKFFYASLVLFVFVFNSCETANKIYIVRHAERGIDPLNDPHITAAGKQRAETLKDILKDKKIRYIFSTQTNRTIETVTPLSKTNNISIQYYRNDTLPNFLQMLTHLKKNILVAGHSNTMIPILDGLHLLHSIASIPDSGYNNIFIVTVKNGKVVTLNESTYESILLLK